MGTGTLNGKVAIVTGAASGIGQAVALRFAEEGAAIMLADRNACDATAGLIAGIGGTCAQTRVNTTSDAACDAMIAETVRLFGRVDTGVFAAGIRQEPTPLLEVEMSAFLTMIDINMTGVLRSARAAARQMLAQGTGGTIVTIASTAGKIPIPGSGPYCVAKAGVIMMTKVLALELAQTGIRVNALAPGFTATPMWDVERNSDEDRWAMAMTPMNRTGTPREQAEAALFLASDASSYTTGQTFYSAGGQFVD